MLLPIHIAAGGLAIVLGAVALSVPRTTVYLASTRPGLWSTDIYLTT
jgi:hypothetical protein